MDYIFNIKDAIAGYIWHHVLDFETIFNHVYDSEYNIPYFDIISELYVDVLKDNYPQFVDLASKIKDEKSYNAFYDVAFNDIENDDNDTMGALYEIDTESVFDKIGDFIESYDSYGTYTLPYDVMDAVCPSSAESDKFFDSIAEIGENNIKEAYNLFADKYVGNKDLNTIAAEIILKDLNEYDDKNYR